MGVRRTTEPVRYNNDLNGSRYDSEDTSPRRNQKATIRVMSARHACTKPAPRTSNADSVAEQFLAEEEQ